MLIHVAPQSRYMNTRGAGTGVQCSAVRVKYGTWYQPGNLPVPGFIQYICTVKKYVNIYYNKLVLTLRPKGPNRDIF